MSRFAAMPIEGIVADAVHDEEHSALHLGDTWHRVAKNLAVEGWRYVPGPMARASVD